MPTTRVRVVSVIGIIILLLPFLFFLANYLASILQSEAEMFTSPTCAAIHFYCFERFFTKWLPNLHHIVRTFGVLDESETFFFKQVDKGAALSL